MIKQNKNHRNVLRHVLLALFALLATSAVGYGDGSDSPSSVARAYYQAANAGKYDAARALYSTNGAMMVAGFGNAFSQNPDERDGLIVTCEKDSKNRTIKKVTIVKKSIDSNSAEVDSKILYDDGTTVIKKLGFEKEAGEWKILGNVD